MLLFYSSISSYDPGGKYLVRQGIESIPSPKQQRQPLPSLLSISFIIQYMGTWYLNPMALAAFGTHWRITKHHWVLLGIFWEDYWGQCFKQFYFNRSWFFVILVFRFFISTFSLSTHNIVKYHNIVNLNIHMYDGIVTIILRLWKVDEMKFRNRPIFIFRADRWNKYWHY